MAAPETDNEQTRVLIDAGDQRMVLMVYELFARADADFEGEAQKETARFPVKVNLQKWPLSGGCRAIAYFPVVPTKDQQANLVMGVFVAGPDGTVQNLVWYVNPAGAVQFGGASKLAESMAKTIAPGARGLEMTTGVRELSVYSKTKSVFVTLPQGYVVTAQQGPDFIVHHVHKVMAFGDPEASLGVYIGDHPSANGEGFVKQGMSTLFGKTVSWYQKIAAVDGSTTFTARALVSLRPYVVGYASPGVSYGPSYADVFATASDALTVEELKSIATTLRLGDRNAQH